MSKVHYMTQEGLEKIKKELEYLKTIERPKISQQIAEAREKGDLSENAEYDAAKEEQGLLELKISKLESMLSRAKIIGTNNISTDEVRVLTKVKVKNLKTGKELTYHLVSPEEADFENGKLSVNSPIGRQLLGKKVGDTVKVTVPAGVIEFQVLEIMK